VVNRDDGAQSWFFVRTVYLGDRHEADTDGGNLVSPHNDLALALGEDLPAKRLRPEPGQSGQVVPVNDNVVEAHRHAASLLGERDGPLANPLFCLCQRVPVVLTSAVTAKQFY
jgi:hypothetical protein